MPIKQAFPDERCSPWIPASISPVHVGWYECRGFRFNGFLHLLWNGAAWEYFGPRHTDPSYPSFGACLSDEWRGVTYDEHHRVRKPGTPLADITGQRFGMVTAIKPEYVATQGGVRWRFRCDCGREFVSNSKWFRAGNSASCGCMRYARGAIKINRPWDKSTTH